MKKVELDKFDNSWYNSGIIVKRMLWGMTSLIFFQNPIPWTNALKTLILRCFGSKVGRNVVIKPSVNIKYPWFVSIGDNSWIGEGAWLDSLAKINIGANVCISQGVYIFTGNHDYKKSTFDLIVKPVVIENGAWIGAKATVCPGLTIGTHSVLTAGSVLTTDTGAYKIYRGNPAVEVRDRQIEE